MKRDLGRGLTSATRCTGDEHGHGPATDAACCWWHQVGGLCMNALCPDDEQKQRLSGYTSAASAVLLTFVVVSVVSVAGAGVWRAVRWILGG